MKNYSSNTYQIHLASKNNQLAIKDDYETLQKLMKDQAQAVSTRISGIDLVTSMSYDWLTVTKATIGPIIAHAGYQGNPRDPGAKSWCLASQTFVGCQTNVRNFQKLQLIFGKIEKLCYKFNAN